MKKKQAVMLTTILICLPSIAYASSIGAIVSSPSVFDGKPVEVAGRVKAFREKISHRGNAYATFMVCASACVKIFTFGSPSIVDGQNVTVDGTFAAVKHMGQYTFYNEIDTEESEIR